METELYSLNLIVAAYIVVVMSTFLLQIFQLLWAHATPQPINIVIIIISIIIAVTDVRASLAVRLYCICTVLNCWCVLWQIHLILSYLILSY